MAEIHNYGLIRFSKKTGKSDKIITALGVGLIQLWALQNTTKTKACVIVDIDEHKAVSEYIGTADGFPEICEDPDKFEYEIPEEAFEIFKAEVAKRAVGA